MIDDTMNKIRGWISIPRNRKAVLAREAGLNKNSMTGIDDPDWDPRYSVLKRLEEAIDRLSALGT